MPSMKFEIIIWQTAESYINGSFELSLPETNKKDTKNLRRKCVKVLNKQAYA